MTVLVVIEAVVIALLALLVAGLLRSHAEILAALHDLGVGLDPAGTSSPPAAPPSFAPTAADAGDAIAAADVSGVTPRGEPVVVGVSGAPQPTLLAFLSSGCITCHGFWDAFASPTLPVPGGARLVVVTMGPESESDSAVARLAPAHLTVVMSSAAWDDYEVPGSPYFVFADGPTGTVVGQGTAPEWSQVVTLMTQAADDGTLTAGREVQQRRRARASHRRARELAGEARVDEALRAAGIEPGDPSLYAPTAGAERAAPTRGRTGDS